MVTVGPFSRRVVTASQTAIAPATSGTSQTTENRKRPRLTLASGRPRRGGTGGAGAPGLTRSSVDISVPPGVPDQPRVEAGGGEHGQDDHGGEGGSTLARHDRGELAEADERRQDRD